MIYAIAVLAVVVGFVLGVVWVDYRRFSRQYDKYQKYVALIPKEPANGPWSNVRVR